MILQELLRPAKSLTDPFTRIDRTPMPPTIKDRDSWVIQIMEHRRALFEKVVAAFPEETATKQSLIGMWRAKLRRPTGIPLSVTG
jgi:hypothetical protein